MLWYIGLEISIQFHITSTKKIYTGLCKKYRKERSSEIQKLTAAYVRLNAAQGTPEGEAGTAIPGEFGMGGGELDFGGG